MKIKLPIALSPRIFLFALLAILFNVLLHQRDVQIDASSEAQTSGGIVKIFTDGTSMAGAGTNGDRIRSLVTMSTGIFGDGSDGALHFDGVTTIAGFTAPQTGSFYSLDPPWDTYLIYLGGRDTFASTVIVDNNVLVDTEGYRFFASTSITTNGTAQLGMPGCSGWAGTGIAPGQGAGNPCLANAGSMPTRGGHGGAGNIGAGSVGENTGAPSARGYAGTGGNGATGVLTGGAGGAVGLGFDATQGDLHTLPSCLSGRTTSVTPIGAVVSAGGGGGGGDNASHHGGGGGEGGGYFVVASPRIVTNNTSKITVAGGNGGNGGTGGGATGGGGGAMGGMLCIVIGGGTQPTISVAGGVGGTGQNGGANGAAGHAGLVMGPGGAAWVVGVQ